MPLLKLVETAVLAKVSLLQLREKSLSARDLYAITASVVKLTYGSSTRLLVNDRADIAFAAGADGVHLTSSSIEPAVVRRTFGERFLIGCSTHSIEEANKAKKGGANFAVFGPVFATASKRHYGEPVGLESLARAAAAVAPFPLLALGGISIENVGDCFRAGASGIAGIGLFNEQTKLTEIVKYIRTEFLKNETRHD